jgi:hypothetical protein
MMLLIIPSASFHEVEVGEMQNYATVIPYTGTGKGFTPGLASLYNDNIS